MTRRFLLNPFDEAQRQTEERGSWIVATVNPRISWPKKRQLVTFEDKEFVLFPQSPDADQTAAIAIRADRYGITAEAARREIMRFCSALSWSEGSGISIIAWGGGNLPRPIGVRLGRSVTEFLETSNLPVAKTKEEQASLALYREGVSLDNPFYGFLSLYKAISALLPNGKKRATWIAEALERLDNNRARERRDALRSQGTDVGAYLWDECRNAIAHAEKEPFVNPDEIDDHFRLSLDLPLLRNLAELAIEEHSSLRRSHTLWREHLYELSGFKSLFPADVIDKLMRSEPIAEGTTVEMPELFTVVARRGAEAISFENMKPRIAGQIVGGILFDLASEDEAITIRTALVFADERLGFDPLRGIGFTPNRKDEKYIRYEINVLRFSRCILSNGHLEVWDQEREAMLGRSETCIPVNCYVNADFYESQLSVLQNLLDAPNLEG